MVEEELARRRPWHLGFKPPVESRFEEDGGPARRRALILAGLFGLCVYNSFLVNDWFVRRLELDAAVAWRSVVTAYGVIVLAAVRSQWVGAVGREWLMATTLVVTMLCSCVIFRVTTSDVRTYDTFAFGLIFLAGNISFPLRFAHALVSSLACFITAAIFIVADERMPQQARIFSLALLAGTALFTVQACHSIERSTRQSYLLRLRETLASRAAERRADLSERLARTDALTELPNRRAFDLALPGRTDAASAAGRWMALVLIDVDYFKQYNDLYGHPAGDGCLRKLAETMRRHTPPGAFLGRIGGEEFAAIIEGPGARTGQEAVERLRRCIEDLAIPHAGSPGRGVVTISLGLALRPPHGPQTAAMLMAAADAALYRAKHAGRNGWFQASNHGEMALTT